MLRPATPLTLLLLGAFALLLLSVLSAPVIKSIPLASFQDVTFGFLGYCTADGCSGFRLGYGNVDDISPGTSANFTFSSRIRNTLSTILVLHPVAAFLTLVSLIMTVAMHGHSLSHSSAYMLASFLLLVLDFLVCAAAFVVDILLFLPHQAWGTYIVLAATVIVLLSAVATCAVRRHMISRKIYRRNAGRNSEIDGDDYYNIQNLVPKPSFTTSSQPTVPVISGANGSPDHLPAFATFETITHEEVLNDDRFPPMNMHNPSERSMAPTYRSNEELSQAGAVGVALSGPTRTNSQDQYRPHLGGMNGHTPYGAPRGAPYGRLNRGSYRGQTGGYNQQPMRGPGGMPARGGPAYGPRGGRGGYGPQPGRGGYGPQGVMRTEGRTPPLTHIPMAEPFDMRGPLDQQAPYRTESPQAYDPSATQSPTAPNRVYTPYSPEPDKPRIASPPAVGIHENLSGPDQRRPVEHPIELDATPASPSDDPSPVGSAISGTAGAQHADAHSSERSNLPAKRTPEDHAISNSQYVPARAAWNQSPQSDSSDLTPPPPPAHEMIHSHSQERMLSVSPVQDGGYYEDVDPRFDQGNGHQGGHQPPQKGGENHELARQRSLAESDQSNFTSISQRGTNPHWESRLPMPQASQTPRQPPQQRHDMILDSSDFRVPRAGADGSRPRGPAAGMTPESAYPIGPL